MKTEGWLGIVGGILLFVSIPILLVELQIMPYRVSPYDLFNSALIGWVLFAFIVTRIVIFAVSGSVLVVVGALLASGKGKMAFAYYMIVFGVLGVVFSFSPLLFDVIGGTLGSTGGYLGIVSGALSRKEIRKQEAALLPLPTPHQLSKISKSLKQLFKGKEYYQCRYTDDSLTYS